jgi:serine/threonine protein kinase
MTGLIPESIGNLTLLQYFILNQFGKTNRFQGPLPSSMSNLIQLRELYLNVVSLTGPLPDFSKLTRLSDCIFIPSDLCIIPGFVPEVGYCDFSVLPDCETVPSYQDCSILADWLPDMFEPYYCCENPSISCQSDRVISLDLSFELTEVMISGIIPDTIGGLEKLQLLFLQGNVLTGNLPSSMANIPLLISVNVTGNMLSGVVPFIPTFEIIGIESNGGLSLPAQIISLAIISDSAKDSGAETIIIAVSSIAAFAIILIVVSTYLILLKRRKQGKGSDIERKLLPRYSCSSEKVRLMSKINSGGFGVVWKARYQKKTVAIKLIRTDKFKDDDLNLQVVRMVVDEAAIMEAMVHDRMVKFLLFEIESLGIVLEYLPLGSLFDHIKCSRGVMPWTDRYQMMLDICEGMEFLHSNVYKDGSTKHVLFHQDLKSANVLMCIEGDPKTLRGKISDFGLSCTYLSLLKLYLVLKDNPMNRRNPVLGDQQASTKVPINGGTICYQAPVSNFVFLIKKELFSWKAMFTRKADVFAAGVIFLELLTLQKPNRLYDDLYPHILEVGLPPALLQCFSNTLEEDPTKRMHFSELFELLKSKDGTAIKAMELGDSATGFDEVEADLRLLMPSSQYQYNK